MGIYGSRGVEYHIVKKDGTRIVIAAERDTDARLETSAYYNERKDAWLRDVYRKPDWIVRPLLSDTLELTASEQAAADKAVGECGGSEGIAEQGWYDVEGTSTTY